MAATTRGALRRGNGFLRWLALNTIVANTDAYGGLSAHNYYLYGSPRHRDRLFWIPWDHDLAMSSGGLGGGAAGGLGGGATAGNVDLFHAGINASWPLIRFFMDDPVYRATYRAHVENLLETVFEPSRLSARLQSEHARIAPFIIGASGESRDNRLPAHRRNSTPPCLVPPASSPTSRAAPPP